MEAKGDTRCYRNNTTERPGTCRKWGTLAVSPEYPSESAVAPMSKSEKRDHTLAPLLSMEGLAIRAEVFARVEAVDEAVKPAAESVATSCWPT